MQPEQVDGESIVSKPEETVHHDGKGLEACGTAEYLVIGNSATFHGTHADGDILSEVGISEGAHSNATAATERTSMHDEDDPELTATSKYFMTKDSPYLSFTSTDIVTSDLLGCTKGLSTLGQAIMSDFGDAETRVAVEYHEDCGVQSLLGLEKSPKDKATDAVDSHEMGTTKAENATEPELPVNGNILPICRKDSVTSLGKDLLEDQEGVHKSVSGTQGTLFGEKHEMGRENASAQAAQSQLEVEFISDITQSIGSDCFVEERISHTGQDYQDDISLPALQTSHDAHNTIKSSEFGTDANSLDKTAQIPLNWKPDGDANYTATVLFPSDSFSQTQIEKAHCSAGITEISDLTQIGANGKREDQILQTEKPKASYANDPETYKGETFCRPELRIMSTVCNYGNDESREDVVNPSATFQPPRTSKVVVVLPGQYPTSKIQRPDKPSEPEVRKNETCSWLKWNAGMDYDGHIVQTDKPKKKLPKYFEKTDEIDYGVYTITHSDQPNIYNVTRGRLRLLPGPSFLKSVKLHEDRRSQSLKPESDLKQLARFLREPKQSGRNPLATEKCYEADLDAEKSLTKEGSRQASIGRFLASSLTPTQVVSQCASYSLTDNSKKRTARKLPAHEGLRIARARNVSRTPANHTSTRATAVKPVPLGKFNVLQVENEIRNVFQNNLEGRWYDPEFCRLGSTALSDLIKSRIKPLVLPSYKLISIVMMGEAKSQGLLVSSLCFWNKQLDNYAEVSYCVNNLWAVGLVYAVDQF